MMWRRFNAMLPEGLQNEDPRIHTGLQLRPEELNRELLTLLALFCADASIVASFEKGLTVTSSREDPLIPLLDAYLEPMITTLLVETAVKNRARIDAWWEQTAEMHAGKSAAERIGVWSVTVGTLDWDATGKQEDLTLREACNKIIHADRVEPVVAPGDPPALTGKVCTLGKLHKKAWRAEIDVRNYVRASIFNSYGGIDFTRGWMRP